MITKAKRLSRRLVPGLLVLGLLGLGHCLPVHRLPVHRLDASARAVNAQATSTNWAGYVVKRSSRHGFSSVTGRWTQPAVSPSAGDGYSAFWVGLGGASEKSQALEQVGASSDVINGQTKYYAWFELVPAPERQVKLAVHPGDHMKGTVTVTGSTVTVSLANQTTGQAVTKTTSMSHPAPDTSTAEWIAEAPSAQTQLAGLQTLPLANFGKVTFTNASATSGGHTGPISDSRWTSQRVQLSPAATLLYPGVGSITLPGSGIGLNQGGASPSALSSDGSSFSVSYTPSGGAFNLRGQRPPCRAQRAYSSSVRLTGVAKPRRADPPPAPPRRCLAGSAGRPESAGRGAPQR